MPRAHLLVVDDEPSILTTLQKALSLEGYSVDVAGGVRVAEERLGKRSYDIMLLDVSLPDGDGVSLLQQLRAGGNEIPVVMMSGHATVDVAVRATRLGAIDFLEKPLSTDRLLLVVENTLRLVRAEEESRALRKAAGHAGELIGQSRAMVQLREQIARAAKAQASVLITGERGTGKELVARAIHQASPRARGPLEKINCAAVPGELIESELFGHEAGAFTGATKQRRGKFERASGGTIFLDEVGGSEAFKIDVRVVAATNRDLIEAAKTGAFRPDLYDRLNVLPLSLPPLRTRREDIRELVQHFLAMASSANDRPGITVSEEALAELTSYSFPGNVRELRNIIERLVILTPDDRIGATDVRTCLGEGAGKEVSGVYRPGVPFRVLSEEAERAILEGALTYHEGHMAQTARALDLERSHLYKKCKALGLRGGKTDEED